jgi:hypothetical protein
LRAWRDRRGLPDRQRRQRLNASQRARKARCILPAAPQLRQRSVNHKRCNTEAA